MQKSLFIYVLASFALMSCHKKSDDINADNNNKNECPDILRVATYNIEHNDPNNIGNPWSNRKTLVKEMFGKYDFDIVVVQELSKSQLDDMQSLVPEYSFVGTNVKGELASGYLWVTVFYKKDRIEIKEFGEFWISATPTILSKGWDAGQYRICTWAKARDKATQKEFYFFSVHLDNTGTAAKTNGVQLLLDTVPIISAGYPAIITGDFNAAQTTSYYMLMVSGNNIKDTYSLTTNRINSTSTTFNNYDANRIGVSRIDHVFVTTQQPIKIHNWAVLTDIFNGKYPSDHFPVMTEISFLEK